MIVVLPKATDLFKVNSNYIKTMTMLFCAFIVDFEQASPRLTS